MPEVAHGEYEFRPDYNSRLSGGYCHIRLPDGFLQFKADVMNSEGSLILHCLGMPALVQHRHLHPGVLSDDVGLAAVEEKHMHGICDLNSAEGRSATANIRSEK